MTLLPPTSTLFPYTTLFRSSPTARKIPSSHARYFGMRAATRTSPRIKIGRAHAELQSRQYLVCRLLLEKKKARKPALLQKAHQAFISAQAHDSQTNEKQIGR